MIPANPYIFHYRLLLTPHRFGHVTNKPPIVDAKFAHRSARSLLRNPTGGHLRILNASVGDLYLCFATTYTPSSRFDCPRVPSKRTFTCAFTAYLSIQLALCCVINFLIHTRRYFGDSGGSLLPSSPRNPERLCSFRFRKILRPRPLVCPPSAECSATRFALPFGAFLSNRNPASCIVIRRIGWNLVGFLPNGEPSSPRPPTSSHPFSTNFHANEGGFH